MNPARKVLMMQGLICGLMMLVLAACSQSSIAVPPPVVVPIEVPAATNTHAPVNTKIPALTATNTPEPTATPTLTPTVQPPEIMDKYFEGVNITSVQTFGSDVTDFWLSQYVSKSDGKISLEGHNYQGGLRYNGTVNKNQGVMFDFMIQPDEVSPKFEFETYFNLGIWETPEYRRFGVYLTGAPEANMWKGATSTGKILTGNLKIKPGELYTIAMAIGDNGDFFAIIWNPEKPGDIRKYRLMLGKEWDLADWGFVINGASGKINIDNIATFSFDSLK